MMIRSFTTLLVILSCSFTVSAAMYKHVDEKGRITYSQYPPASGKAERIKPPPPPATQVEPAPGKAAAGGDKGKEGAAKKTAKSDSKRKAASNKIKAENCTRARKSLEMYNNPQYRLVKTPDGVYERVTDEKRTKGIENAKKNIQEFCN